MMTKSTMMHLCLIAFIELALSLLLLFVLLLLVLKPSLMQEPVLFSVSVGENIAYGLPDDNVSKDDIIRAAKAANAHDFIISLPQVYIFLGKLVLTTCYTKIWI